jgi:hypothetical protein
MSRVRIKTGRVRVAHFVARHVLVSDALFSSDLAAGELDPEGWSSTDRKIEDHPVGLLLSGLQPCGPNRYPCSGSLHLIRPSWKALAYAYESADRWRHSNLSRVRPVSVFIGNNGRAQPCPVDQVGATLNHDVQGIRAC